MRNYRILFLSLIILLFVMVPLGAAQDDRLQIVASHSILADTVAVVTGDAADVMATMPRGADPHGFVPTPSDLTAIADADVVFVNGAMFEEGLMEAIENADTDMNIVIASSCVEVIAFGAGSHDEDEHDHEEAHDDHEHEDDDDHEAEHAHEEGEMSAIASLCAAHHDEMHALHGDEHDDEAEAHDDEHAHEEDHEHDYAAVETLGMLYAVDCGEAHAHEADDDHADEEHDHAHGACDPHVWMDPHNVIYWTMLIRDTLADLDPSNAETYTTNANAYIEELDALAHDFVMPMVDSVPEANRVLVTNHEALGYFAAKNGFEVITTVIPGGSTLAEPSAADVAAIIDLIREEEVSAIFAETTVSDNLAQQIAEETGAEIHVLYTGSLSDDAGPAATYVDYIRYNVTTLVEALGGGMS